MVFVGLVCFFNKDSTERYLYMFHLHPCGGKHILITFKIKPLSRTLFIQISLLWKVNNSVLNVPPDLISSNQFYQFSLSQRLLLMYCSFPHILCFFTPISSAEYFYVITSESELQGKY